LNLGLRAMTPKMVPSLTRLAGWRANSSVGADDPLRFSGRASGAIDAKKEAQ
jgi:hypothetical protein